MNDVFLSLNAMAKHCINEDVLLSHCKDGNAFVVRHLLQTFHVPYIKQKSFLLHACMWNQIDVVRVLLEKWKISITNDVISHALMNGDNLDMFHLLFRQYNGIIYIEQIPVRWLEIAIWYGRIKTAKWIFKNIQNDNHTYKITPIQIKRLILMGHFEMVIWVYSIYNQPPPLHHIVEGFMVRQMIRRWVRRRRTRRLGIIYMTEILKSTTIR